MILTGPEIRRQVERGTIEIDPYVPGHVNPASVDLTLGRTVAEYMLMSERKMSATEIGDRFERSDAETGDRFEYFLDSKREYHVTRQPIPESGLLIRPGHLYLMHTVERVRTDRYVIVIDGKSSLARLGVLVHLTAGYVDPGFDGNYTLEVACVLPVRLYAGMRVCQIRFQALVGEVEDYKQRGNYVGERAAGPVPSQSWRQFK